MNKVAINTLGCRTNQLESSIIADELKQNGWQIVKFNEKADLYIINTCTVTGKSDTTSRYYIRQAKRNNPSAKIIVTGCYAQTSTEEIEKLEEVDLIIGNLEKQYLIDYIKNMDLNNKVIVSDIMQENTFKDKKVFSALDRARINIKIQDGCNFKCSYCIIPYARGKSRSNPIDNVVVQVRNVVDNGYQEIVLTGIHLGQWGLDLEPKNSLANLISELEKINGLKRFRIGSIDPLEFNQELIECLINSRKFCRHLHVSLQSGNNEVLKRMRRRYTVEHYSDLIWHLHNNIPDIGIGSDIIVGFPGETDEMFEDTYNNLKNLSLSYIHVFPYSKRKGTPAAEMKDQVKDSVKKSRVNKLRELAENKNLEFRQSLWNKEFNIVIEFSRDRRTGLLKGITDNFVSVLVDGEDSLKGKLIKTKISQVNKDSTIGEIVDIS